MIRRSLLLIVLIGSSLVSTFAKKATPPNIIFILTDDQRWDALGYAGNEVIKTPEMDKLASEGVYFSQAMVTTPICAASRASLFTGLYERTHRFDFQAGDVKDQYMDQAYPTLLREAGYYTGFFGKFGVKYKKLDKLFDAYDSYDRAGMPDRRSYFYKTIGEDTVHLTRYTGQQGQDFIKTAPKDKPFCLQLCFSAPHAADGAEDQYFWQDQTDHLYQGMEMAPAKISDDSYFNALPKEVRDGFNRLRWTWRYDTPQKYQHSVKGYYRMIAGIDLEIGKIKKLLKEQGLDKNTIIVLMGDNGYFLGERQLAGKWLMYDNSLRVPLIIFDPRENKHLDVEDMALNIDVPATILDMAGVNIPEHWQGKSLYPLVSGIESSLHRDTVLVEHLWDFEHIPPSEGIRTEQWKYMRYVNNKSIEELYDLDKDPMEINNLVTQKANQSLLTDLRSKCDQLGDRYSDAYSQGPTGLSVELIREPQHVLIVDAKPEFSWLIPATAQAQKGYQLLVSSSMEKINNNIGDLWDTGHRPSGLSGNVEYDGSSLEAGQACFWKVRIWDVDNRLSRYSEMQVFTLGASESGGISTGNFFTVEKIKPVKSDRRGDVLFIDFGKDAFATLQLNFTPKKKEKLTIRLGEKLIDGKIDPKPGGTIRFQEVKLNVSPEKNMYQVQLKADKRNTKSVAVALPDSIPVLLPFRYCEIQGSDIAADQVVQLAYFNYFDEHTSSFSSSDTILNQVWDLCKYSIKATTFAGYYIDGDRERIPYEADAYLNQLSHYSVDNEYAMARKTIEYFMLYPTWPTEWQLHVALMFYQDYMYTGNTELIEKYYEPLKYKTLMDLEYEDGLISTFSHKHNGVLMSNLGFPDTTSRLKDIVDWPPAQKDTGWKLATAAGERDGFVFRPVNTVINSFYYKNMVIMAEFARLLHKPDEALDFELRAMKAKKSINEKLYNMEKGYYVDGIGTDHGSVHANMMALAFDVVPEVHKKSVAAYIKTRGMGCSVYGAQFLMEALYNAGEGEYALELMTATHDRSWYNMINVGSTISMEAWDMKYKPNADWNHAWGAAPANIIPRGLWGIQPKVAGYKVVGIQPQMGSLKECSIEVPTPFGQIKGTYKRLSNRQTRYSIELPANVVGEFMVDFSPQDVVTINGEKMDLSFGSLRLSSGVNDMVIQINSF